MELNLMDIDITLTFTPDDLAWMKQTGTAVPPFWTGHSIAPAVGDVLRLGDRQFAVFGRAWEHNGSRPVLRLYLTASEPVKSETLH
jgi:hypothetical protein